MKTTLHKLPEGFIITSNEHPNEEEWYLSCEDKLLKFTGRFCLGDKLPKECKKIIAQQDQIDFSNLTEEEQKEIGFFNIMDYADKYTSKLVLTSEGRTQRWWGIQEGFKKAQELLSDRRFTLEDMIKAWDNGFEEGNSSSQFREVYSDKYIQSLSQPKSWTVELEMEEKCWCMKPESGGCFECIKKPKLTDGKIKILKLL
jgi:hypothetical protein